MLTINLNHECDVISEVLGISKDQLVKTKAAMIFSVLSPKILGDSLFDDENEIPANMKTASGSIEIMLSHCDTDEMKTFSLLNFFNMRESLLGAYHLIKDDKKINELLKDEKDELQKAIKMLAVQFKMKPVTMLIDLITKSNGDFNKFHENIKEAIKSIDDISNAFDIDFKD